MEGVLTAQYRLLFFLNTMFVVRKFCIEGAFYTRYSNNISYNEHEIEIMWLNIMECINNETLIISRNCMSLLRHIQRLFEIKWKMTNCLEQIADGKLFGKEIDTYHGQNIKLRNSTLQWRTQLTQMIIHE